MVSGDPIQRAGATDLAAYVPHALMPVKLIQITPESKSDYKQHFKNIAKSAALLVIQAVLASKVILIPVLIASFFKANPLQEAEKIYDNINDIIDKTRHAHRDFHFDKKKHTMAYEIMTNEKDNIFAERINKILAKKVPVFSCKPYKFLKKALYEGYHLIQQKMSSPNKSQDPTPTIQITRADGSIAVLSDHMDKTLNMFHNLHPQTKPPTRDQAEQQETRANLKHSPAHNREDPTQSN